jgi:hypothetical protein
VPIIGRGSALGQGGGGGGRGGLRSQISPPSHPEYTKTAKKRVVSRIFWPINHQKDVFRSKVLNKIYSQDVF